MVSTMAQEFMKVSGKTEGIDPDFWGGGVGEGAEKWREVLREGLSGFFCSMYPSLASTSLKI